MNYPDAPIRIHLDCNVYMLTLSIYSALIERLFIHFQQDQALTPTLKARLK